MDDSGNFAASSEILVSETTRKTAEFGGIQSKVADFAADSGICC